MDNVIRKLQITPLEGQTVTTSKGMVDPRLWKGENELYAEMDNTTCMWRLRYKHGMLPPQIQGTYTNFDKAFKAATKYYSTRGLEVTRVI